MSAGLFLAAASPAERAAPPAPYAEANVAVDTLRAAVRAGETLVVGLPAQVGGAEATYEVVQAPALSWLIDRSFMWRTLDRERGALPVRFRRTVAGGGSDLVVLLVEIQP